MSEVAVKLRPFSLDLRTAAQRSQGAALAQEFADMRLEREWRRRVAENVRRRATNKPTEAR